MQPTIYDSGRGLSFEFDLCALFLLYPELLQQLSLLMLSQVAQGQLW